MIASEQEKIRSLSPAPLHPNVWRANQLAISRTMTLGTGCQALDQELPGGGWPRSVLVELLVQQAGIGEMQLLKPALTAMSQTQKIALVQPPYRPQAMACRSWGMRVDNLLWIKASSGADGLWATEQILKHGCCGAVIVWQSAIRIESLRRLHLAAQSADTWLWLIRPLTARMDSSPAQLRLALRPAIGAVKVEIVKRRGPLSDQILLIPLADMPVPRHQQAEEHASVVSHSSPITATRSTTPQLV